MRTLLLDLIALVKIRPTLMAAAAAAAGYLMVASGGAVDGERFLMLAAGSLLIGAGCAALNQWMEPKADGLMDRTKNRPLPRGRMRQRSVAAFGTGVSLLGIGLLGWGINILTGFIGAVIVGLYVFIYTPLKKKTLHAFWIGAVAGALPPVLGTAAAGRVGLEAALMFIILFLWQFPHFSAIAWTFREDYARAGIPTFASRDSEGVRVGRQMMMGTAGVVGASMLPFLLGVSGNFYLTSVCLAGGTFLFFSLRYGPRRGAGSTKRFALASVVYLPLVFFTLIFDRFMPIFL